MEITNEIIMSELQEIKKLLTIKPKETSTKETLTVEELSEYTGLSKSYIYHLTCKRLIPFYKSEGGGRTYFKRSEIDAWMLAARYETIQETEERVGTNVLY